MHSNHLLLTGLQNSEIHIELQNAVQKTLRRQSPSCISPHFLTAPVRRRILCADGEGSRLVGERQSSGKKVKKDVCCDASEFSLRSIRRCDVLTLLPVSGRKGHPRSSSQKQTLLLLFFFSPPFCRSGQPQSPASFFFSACVCRSRPIFWHAEPELNQYGPLPGAHPVFPLTRAPFNTTPPRTRRRRRGLGWGWGARSTSDQWDPSLVSSSSPYFILGSAGRW